MEFIAGRLGGEKDILLASQVVRVIVAGNSVVTTDVIRGKDRYVRTNVGIFVLIID